MHLIFENEIGTSYYDEERCILIYKSKKIIVNHKTELIKILLENTYNLVQNKIVIGEVVDLIGMRGNYKLILEYLIYHYYPKMKDSGMKKAAYIVPDDLISKNLAQKICAQNRIPTKTFQHMDQAIDWLTAN